MAGPFYQAGSAPPLGGKDKCFAPCSWQYCSAVLLEANPSSPWLGREQTPFPVGLGSISGRINATFKDVSVLPVDRTGPMTEVQVGQGEKNHKGNKRQGKTELKGSDVNELGRFFC